MIENLSRDAVNAEIANFTNVLEQGGVTSSIPGIFTYWACKYLSPRVRTVFGEADVNAIFAREILECADTFLERKTVRILSLGSGDSRTELEIAKKLVDAGVSIELTCTDLNPVVSGFACELAKNEGLAPLFRFEVMDLNSEFPDGAFDVVMANHSLHHFVGLEEIFDSVHSHLSDRGAFIISDMIGRNGHQRWPEALPFVEALWNFLPPEKRFNNFAKCVESEYVKFDCTSDGTFEGLRAQDILPLLWKRFNFKKFVAHGNVIDIFIDRAYGGNFSPDSEDDCRFIDYVEALNTHLIDVGVVKPTAMFATLVKYPCECHYDRWAPDFCIRVVPT